ncbi:HNH endonuclease [Acidovorax phage ACP17]|uniref:Uncharacterized protein n=1 Tax=Acidovorax phage ACP17 TaxID=2010329 RepID=A0A223AJ00_9CAUD|nr:HNH endonuclease [Acidovorax phage ACP17]ASS33939.1 hypothetical protein [Acidovorax phage ACP17]
MKQKRSYDCRPIQWDVVKKKLHFHKLAAMRRGLDFNLSAMSVYNLLRARRCYYTGIEMTEALPHKHGVSGINLLTDRTFERLDASKGYVIGNVVSCCRGVNSLKGQLERDGEPVDPEDLKIIIKEVRRVILEVN